jgi:hypothetical protein
MSFNQLIKHSRTPGSSAARVILNYKLDLLARDAEMMVIRSGVRRTLVDIVYPPINQEKRMEKRMTEPFDRIWRGEEV